ncbi:MAG: bifunctional metallophosphatase/5'-nucleotidase [Melioribacteraceae bacterium]|nr:bifunctional metallophosphatase/5'-nucleotidase [Melioribacteraceae bacterium]
MKNSIKQIFLIIILSYASILSQTINLKIIQTTDEHGALFPYDFTDQKEVKNSIAQIYSYVKQEREKKNQEVILLSGGDILQGTPVVYYYNFERTNVTNIFSEAMNFMKYDAAAVGNHDIETGHPVYDKFNREIKFPWLAANAISKKTGKPYLKPYTVIKRKGLKIAILGLITPYIPHWLPEKIWSGIEFEDMVKSAKHWIKIIKEKEKPDLMIGLFHSGVDYTYGNQSIDDEKNENASKIVAQKVPGFDIIFVGHDHHGWNFKEKCVDGNDVQILGATNSGRDASVANCVLTYDKTLKKWNKEISGEIIEAKNFSPDLSLMKKFNTHFDEVKKYVSKELGFFTEPIYSRDAIFGNSSFTDLINKVQLDETGADISFTAPLSLNAKIEAGSVNVGTMFKLYRYENFLYTMSLTGKEVKDYLEYSYSIWFNQMKDENDNLLKFRKDENGNLKYDNRNQAPLLENQYYNFDCADGINYTVDVSKPFGERINILSLDNGEKFQLDKTYKVAVNSYRGNGGGGHLINGAKISKEELNKRIINSTEKDFRFYIMKWIEKQKTITPIKSDNWKVIPEDWWKKGKEKDFNLMFGSK